MSSGTALADSGEGSISLTIDNELAVLHHPGVDYSRGGGAQEYLARVGVNAVFGLTEWLDLGAGLRTAIPIDTVEQGVDYQGYQNGELFSSYWDMFLPVAAALRWPARPTFSVALSVETGLVVTRWRTAQMQASTQNSNAIPRAYPIEQSTQWGADGFWRVSLVSEWRPADWLFINLSPYFSMAFRSHDRYAGLHLRISYVFGVGFA